MKTLTIDQAANLVARRAMKRKTDTQKDKNDQRLREYRKKMHLWVIEHGITHRACELFYFGTSTYTDLKKNLNR